MESTGEIMAGESTCETERLINYISERLHQANKENVILKAKGQFNCNQASNTQKRLVEDIGSWVVKNIIRTRSHGKWKEEDEEWKKKG